MGLPRFSIQAGSSTVVQTFVTEQGGAVLSTLPYYLHSDRLGSITLVTDSSGSVLERRTYDPFGSHRSTTALATPASLPFGSVKLGFTGHRADDDLGLIDMGGRQYDPSLQKFIEADPIIGHPSMARSYNPYGYALENPLLWTDPSGFTEYWVSDGVDSSGAYVFEPPKQQSQQQQRPVFLYDVEKGMLPPDGAKFSDSIQNPITRNVAIKFATGFAVGVSLQARQAYLAMKQRLTDPTPAQISSDFRNNIGTALFPALPVVHMASGVLHTGRELLQSWSMLADQALLAKDPFAAGMMSVTPAEDASSLMSTVFSIATLVPGPSSLGAGVESAASQAAKGSVGDLTTAEAKQIQSVVDQAGRPLEVVGSAAKGARRGVGTDLPIGKGPGTQSDIDYLVPPGSAPYYQGLESQLPGLDAKSGIIPGTHNPYMGPAVRFEPGTPPRFVPEGTP